MAKKPRLIRGKDYVIDDDGAWEFTRDYLLGLGSCCKNKCRYCPYKDSGCGPTAPVDPDACDTSAADLPAGTLQRLC